MSKKNTPFIMSDAFDDLSKKQETDATKIRTGNTETPTDKTPAADTKNTNKKTPATKAEIKPTVKKDPEIIPQHPVLSGERDKPVMLYRKLHDLLLLLKMKRKLDINKTVNEFIYEHLKEKGLLKELELLQETMNK